jgi:molybdopterin/thiamine biosynthesis adenylyltransferase
MSREMKIVVIGLGGVGSILCERLARFLNYSVDLDAELYLVDGDIYETKNYERQEFTQMGNKAEIKAGDLDEQYPQIKLDFYSAYINEANIAQVIRSGDIVFLCVDNHKTRMIVSNYCKQLNDVTLISGGNEFTDGNVQIYIRKEGKDLTPDLCAYHPEIANPKDKLPEELSCEQLAKSDPQLYFTNLFVATLMCGAFYNVVIREKIGASEIYFDMIQMSTIAQSRALKQETKTKTKS